MSDERKPPEDDPADRFDIVEPTGEAAAEKSPAVRPAPGGPPPPMDIEWFDEDHPPDQGHVFTAPSPEPPPLAFEVVRETPPPAAPPGTSNASAPARPSREAPLPPLIMRLFWGFLPLLLVIAGYASVVLTQNRVGYSWDESYYYEPSLKAADWLTEVIRGRRPFDRDAISEYWSENTEHPSMMKFMSGLALRSFANPRHHLEAMRLPMAILFGLTLALIYMIGRRAFGPMSGLIAAVLYATLPRVFGHAHFASLETPLLFMTVLVVFCFLRGLDSRFWAAMTGISFGLLLATKLNGFFLPIPLILWAHLFARQRYVNNLFAMLTLGPLVMVAAWPWLWHDTPQRLLEYLYFHAIHQKTAVFYLGQTWGYTATPNAPWHYPSVMILTTTPLLALALILIGIARTLMRPHRRPYGTLFLMCALVMWAVISMPAAPKYDGVRLLLPVFPFLALLAGSGFVGLIHRIEQLLARRSASDPARLARFIHRLAFAFVLLLLVEGGGAIWRYYPFMLSYYNPLVGGLAGAADRFEAIYWGEALNQTVIDQLNSLPDGSRIKPLVLHERNFEHLQRWGRLKDTLQIGGSPPFDFHILQFRRGFFSRPERALAETGLFEPVFPPVEKFGVPLLAIYRTGPRFEEVWPRLAPR